MSYFNEKGELIDAPKTGPNVPSGVNQEAPVVVVPPADEKDLEGLETPGETSPGAPD